MNPGSGQGNKRLYEFGDFRVDPWERVLARNGQRIALPPKAFDTLLILVQHTGHVVSKEDLVNTLWPDSFVEENNLTQQISQLRRALGQNSNGAAYIETVPTLGYRFVPEVREIADGERELVVSRRTRTHIILYEEKVAEELPDSLSEPVRTVDAHQRRSWRPRNKWIVLAAILATTAGMVIAGFVRWRPRTAAGPPAQASTMVVVLPFRNLTPSPDSDYLGAALAKMTSSELSYTSQITSHPPTPFNSYNGTDPTLERDPQGAPRQVFVNGSYVKEEENVKLFLELVAEPGHVTLWHGHLAVSRASLVSLQDLISDQIGAALHVPVHHSATQPQTSANHPPDPAAYEYFLRGLSSDLRGISDLRDAIQWHEKAVSANPDFGTAVAHLALDYASYCYYQSSLGARPTEIESGYLDKSVALYQQAIDRSAASPAVLSVGGLYLMELGRLDESVVLLRRAVQLNPNYAQSHLWLSQAYRYGGMLQESRSEAELALRLDPEIREYTSVNTYLYLGEYDKFIQSLSRRDLGARVLFYRGLAHYYQGDLSEAERDFRSAHEMQPSHPHAQYAQAFLRALAAQNDEGLQELRRFEQDYRADGEMLYKTAQAYAILGDKRSAIRLLRQSIAHNFYCYPCFVQDPLLASVRGDPEYLSVIQLAHARHDAFTQRFFLSPL